MADGAEDRLQQLHPEVFGRSRPLPPDRPASYLEVELDDEEIVVTRKIPG